MVLLPRFNSEIQVVCVKAYPGLGELGVGVGIVDAQEAELHPHVNEIAKRENLDVLSHDTCGHNFIALPEAGESNEVAGEEWGHYQRVGSSTGPTVSHVSNESPGIGGAEEEKRGIPSDNS